jgi:signal transduction histidine kinase
MGAPGGDVRRSRTQSATAPRALTVGAALIGLVVTTFILTTPYLAFGVESAQGHLVLNTIDAFIGLVAAYLVYGRFNRHARLQDLLLLQGLALLVVAGLGLSELVTLSSEIRPGTLDVWLPLSIRLLGALLIAAAAIAGPHGRVVLQRGYLWPSLSLALAVCMTAMALWAWESTLPLALDLGAQPDSAQSLFVTGHPLLIAGQVLGALSLALAAVLFTQQAQDSENKLLLWLGPACALGAFARLNYVLFPSLYTDWLYTGDLLRTGFYVLLLVGAAREIQRYWVDQADLAVLDDRRRLARELHDGVIQELSFIRSQTSVLPGDSAAHQPILSACDRGLEEARAAVAALGTQGDEPLSVVLARATRQLAEQYGVDVVLHLDDSVPVSDPEERHALVRIAREAVTNAVKHGAARTIHVVLSRGEDGRCLAVRDDGSGFDVDAATRHGGPGGYGLISMRDRAHGLGGRLDVESAPGAGTLLRVTW